MHRRFVSLLAVMGSLLIAWPGHTSAAPLSSSGMPEPLFALSENDPTEPIEPGYVENELIVRFKPGTAQHTKNELHSRFGAQVIREAPEHGLQLLRLYDDATVSVFAYQSRPEVVFAEPNYLASIYGAPAPGAPILSAADLEALPGVMAAAPGGLLAVPSDPLYSSQWHHAKVGMPRAWDYSRGGQVVVAVIDSGVMCGHADLSGKCTAGYDFVNQDSDPADDHGHGTHVAGIIGAATNNARGVAGTAWDIRVMPIKSLNSAGRGSHFDIAAGIDWSVSHGASVINMSLGAYFTSSTLQSAVSRAINQGVVVVAAAGNDAVSNPTYPAVYPGVIGVAATTQSDGRASFSNFGDFVDVAAPGVGILSTVMTGSYQAWNGTSMASPIVAAVAGLLMDQDATRSPAEIQSILESTAVDLGAPGRDSLFGSGRVDAGAALASHGGVPATATPIGPTATFAPPSPTPTSALDWVQQVEDLINVERSQHGLAPLHTDLGLRAASARHVGDMGDGAFCSHNGSDGSTAYTRMRDAGYTRPYGEIVACGQVNPPAVVAAWMASNLGHRDLILCSLCTEFGAGHRGTNFGYRNYWTVTFGQETTSGPTPTLIAPPTPQASATIGPPTPTPSPSPTPPAVPPGGTELQIPAANNRIGWVVSVQPDRNYFDDDDTFTGTYNGRVYHGAMQFDLDSVPPGAYVTYARLELVGRSRSFIGTTGTWAVRLLDSAIDPGFASHGYAQIHPAVAEATLLPLLGVNELFEGQANIFTFTPSQVSSLQTRVGGSRQISFRLDGPTAESGMNLFTWDSGYGPDSRYPGAKLILHYTLSPPTEAPTATPTDENQPTEEPPVPTDGPTPTATATEIPPTLTATAPPPPDYTPTATAVPPIEPGPGDGGLVEIAPTCGDIGWVKQGEPGNHFCSDETYTGYYLGYVHHGAMQFDLSALPKDSEIISARLTLTGRTTRYLSPFGNGLWKVVMLHPAIDFGWRGHSYANLYSARSVALLRPDLSQADLDVGRQNIFLFNEDQKRHLKDRILGTGKISFRLDGPRAGTSNVFSWSTGYGGGDPPILSLVFGPPGSGDAPVPTPDPQEVERVLDIVHRINVEREKAGSGPVAISEDLGRAAREHNMDMTWNNFFSHTGSDGSVPLIRVERTGYRPAAVGELLAAATSDAERIVSAWMSIEGQRATLVDPRWSAIGVHYTWRERTSYRHYWTVVLAQPAP
jgi:uncharacterized protein YkwD